MLFQNNTVIPDYIRMLRFLGTADRTIGIILYYHTTLARHIMWWTRPALEAGLRLMQSQEIVHFDVTVLACSHSLEPTPEYRPRMGLALAPPGSMGGVLQMQL